MKKVFLFIFILSLFFPFVNPVFADGSILILDDDEWGLFSEEKQYCAINHKEGIQNMILTVDTGEELTGEKAVWIFPVPAKPEETEINIMQGFPKFNGYDIERKLKENISGISSIMSLTQVYTLPYFMTNWVFGTTASSLLEGITVHDSVEKMGLITELVSARDSSSMTKYVSSKGLDLPEVSQSVIDEYIGKDYSFVISWISDVRAFKDKQKKEKKYEGRWSGNAIGVFVTFPTEKIYYPLRLTSVYGDKEVPTVIYVLDHVKPEPYDEIRPYTKTKYYFDNEVVVPKELNDFFKGYSKNSSSNSIGQEFSIKNVKYTKIELSPPSNYLNQDLWMSNSAPIKISIAHSVNRFTLIFFCLLFILFSCTASLLSGLITFQNNQISKNKLALLGLWNFLTLIGFSVAALGSKALNAAQLRSHHKNNHLFFKLIFLFLLVFGISSSILLFTFDRLFFDPRDEVLIYIKSIGLAMYSMFMAWGYSSNKKAIRFITLFTFFFIVLSFITTLFIKFLT